MILCVALGFVSSSNGLASDTNNATTIQDLSLLALLGDGEQYVGKKVRVVGYAVVYDYAAILPNASFHDEGYTPLNSIQLAVDCDSCQTPDEERAFYTGVKSRFHLQYVLVEGIFTETGNFSLPYAIHEINRLEVWKATNERLIDDDPL